MRRERWRTALLLAAATTAATCTPIPARDDGATLAAPEAGQDLFTYDPAVRPLRLGDRVPDFAFIDSTGRPFSLAALRERVVILTFFAAGDAEGEGEILTRFAAVHEALDGALADDTHLVAMLIDASPGAPDVLRSRAAMASRPDVRWTFARATPEVTAAMVATFGVAMWQAPSGAIQHTFNTVVIDRRGRFADQFPGLDAWSPMDVVAAAAAAAGH